MDIQYWGDFLQNETHRISFERSNGEDRYFVARVYMQFSGHWILYLDGYYLRVNHRLIGRRFVHLYFHMIEQRYFKFSSKQLSYHDNPDSPAKGVFDYSNHTCIDILLVFTFSYMLAERRCPFLQTAVFVFQVGQMEYSGCDGIEVRVVDLPLLRVM